jgi:hypothetical protein
MNSENKLEHYHLWPRFQRLVPLVHPCGGTPPRRDDVQWNMSEQLKTRRAFLAAKWRGRNCRTADSRVPLRFSGSGTIWIWRSVNINQFRSNRKFTLTLEIGG